MSRIKKFALEIEEEVTKRLNKGEEPNIAIRKGVGTILYRYDIVGKATECFAYGVKTFRAWRDQQPEREVESA